ncbi:leucine-rich repeat-containing protein 51-like [Lycorma delicatula]|uniref:leucine-rich repeat-containing protein 51-like n=1 Tax=Lycorma delicatula TaxID=130591 RepID=UPI003F5183A4
MAQSSSSNIKEIDLNRIPPVDFSFKKIETLIEIILYDKPRGGRVKSVPSRGPKNHFVTAGIWLNNNNLHTTEGLSEMVENTLEYPHRLAWLDLSFNKIDTITADIAKFINLKILYLHGNNIQDLQMVLKIKPLASLRTLTMHGNPIDSIPSYRSYLVKILDQIINLDFVTIAPSERLAPPPPGLSDVFSNHFNKFSTRQMH